MTVQQLIKKLMEFNPEHEIEIELLYGIGLNRIESYTTTDILDIYEITNNTVVLQGDYI